MSDLNILPRDQNHVTTAGFANSLDLTDVRPGQIIVATGRIKVDGSGGAGGTVTEVDTGTGLTGGPITSTGTISLDTKLAPMDSLTGNSLKVLRVNVGETAVEYVTPSSGGTPGGSNTQVQFNNAGAFGGISGVITNGTSMQFSPNDLLIEGSGSGGVTLNAPATGGGTLTLPAGTDTIAGVAAAQALTNKSVNGVTLTTGGATTSFLNANGAYSTPAGGGSGGNGFAWFIS